MKITVSMKPQVVYRLTAIRRNRAGRIVSARQSADCPNVFTNYGVESAFGAPGTAPFNGISAAVGTGSSEFQITDTRLNNFLAGASQGGSASHSFVNNGDGSGYWQSAKNTLFSVGAATGNISEIGSHFASGSAPNASTDLGSLALVVDGSGNPTTFEVLSDEELLLTQFFRRNFSLNDITLFDVPIDGDGPNQDITIRPFNMGSPTSFPTVHGTNGIYGRALWGEVYNLPAITDSQGSSSGTGSGQANTSQGTQYTLVPYVPNSKEIEFILRRPTGAAENIVGFEFSLPGFVRYAVKLDPGIPKSELHRSQVSLICKIDNTP